jgi:SAM-dependent methyltransferase
LSSAEAVNYDRLIFDPLIRRYYGGSRAYNVGYWGFGAVTQAEASRDLVHQLLSRVTVSPNRILDVACGLGETTGLIQQGWPAASVTGINFSTQQVDACRTLQKGCNFEVMDAVALQFPDNFFDVIVCVEAPMHFHTRAAFLHEAFRVLKPGGQLVLSDMLFTSAAWLASWYVPPENHIQDMASYRETLVDAGFTDIVVEDRNEVCWRAFCRSLGKWLQAPEQADLDPEAVRPWTDNLDSLQGAIAHYPLASMSKPIGDDDPKPLTPNHTISDTGSNLNFRNLVTLGTTSMRQIFLEEGLQRAFMDRGFVQVPMLSSAEVAHLLDQIATLRPADGFAPKGNEGFGQTYHCSFLDKNVDYKRRTHELIKRVFAPGIDRVLKGYEILNCNFYVKPPGTGEFVIHQNWPAIADLHDTTVTVWSPLVDVVAENGALQFVEGSHKILPHIEGPMTPGFFDHFRKELIEKYLTPNPMSAGEALIFDDGLIHWSARNQGTEARVAIQILCIPKEVPPVFFFYDPAHPERFEVIEVDSEFFITSAFTDLTQRQPEWKSLGFIENRNRFLDEAEFVSLLARGPEIRQQIYSGGTW